MESGLQETGRRSERVRRTQPWSRWKVMATACRSMVVEMGRRHWVLEGFPSDLARAGFSAGMKEQPGVAFRTL